MKPLRQKQIPLLVFGLALSASTTAGEHGAPDVPATSARPAATANSGIPTSPKPPTAAAATKPKAEAKSEVAEEAPAGPTKSAAAKPAAGKEAAKPETGEAAAASKIEIAWSKGGAAPASAKPAMAAIVAKLEEQEAALEKRRQEKIAAHHPRSRPRPYVAPGMQRVALSSAAAHPQVPSPAPVAAPTPHSLHWSYSGATGPQAWSKLAPEYAKCGNGERQSPIDIQDGLKVDLEPITFEYRPSGYKVTDNGHTIQANVNGWNQMRVMGRRFKLVQFHFHTPSEESINGRQFDMVVHLVHKDAEDRLAVVAVLVEGGSRQPAIQAVLNNLPLERSQEVHVSGGLDMTQMLPADRKYFTYMGSLTTPPCTEDVLWIVMKQPVQASADQLNLISRLYPMNARPTQSAKGRMIKESN